MENETNQSDEMAPSLPRQTELTKAYERNSANGKPPYHQVKIRTRGELTWVLQERHWSGSRQAAEQERANLAGVNLVGVDLSGIHLNWADFRGAVLQRTNLAEAHLFRANFNGANLLHANVSNADLRRADCQLANLRLTNLQGTDLRRALLGGANLQGAQMDSATVLAFATLDSRTLLGDIVWNGVPLALVDWRHIPRIGDERPTKTADAQQNEDDIQSEQDAKPTKEQRYYTFRNAARAYRGLALELQSQGLGEEAAKYRLRGRVMERKALVSQRKFGRWSFSWLLNVVAGNGDRPERALFAYVLVVFAFAAIYYWLGRTADFVSPLGALVFSLTSFHGRGFFPGSLSLVDPVTVLASLEAVIGLFIELVFVATFSRRFLND